MIVLDTHALIWWVSDDKRLSSTARKSIEQVLANNGRLLVSAISAWEIAMLVEKGRLVLSMELDNWLELVESISGLQFIPIDVAQSVQSVRLPGEFHADPADRMIVSLARRRGIPLLTADQKILAYKHVKTIW